MISVIAFDYGGVIEISEKDLLGEIISYLHTTQEEWSTAYFSLNHLCNTGQNTWEEVVILTSEKLGASSENVLFIKELIQKDLVNKILNTELITYIKTLKPKYTIALISNYSSKLRLKLEQQGILDLFDELAISGEIGFQKPNPEIFYFLCKKLDILPSNLIFIDDSPKSLEKANTIGYIPILYKNNKDLFSNLANLLQ